MNREALQDALSAVFPAAVFENGSEWLTLDVDGNAWEEGARSIRSIRELDFDYLFCITGVDWKTHLTVVYHLTSTNHRHIAVIKIKLDRENPELATVPDIWRTAEFHEREVFDLFGIRFKGHPDLRRLFMTDEWRGWPLRKDYEDPVNMIKL
jgi:NADH-quinone oxidoreductase subunit C